MTATGYVMIDETGAVIAVSVDGAQDLAKSHIAGYVRKNGQRQRNMTINVRRRRKSPKVVISIILTLLGAVISVLTLPARLRR